MVLCCYVNVLYGSGMTSCISQKINVITKYLGSYLALIDIEMYTLRGR